MKERILLEKDLWLSGMLTKDAYQFKTDDHTLRPDKEHFYSIVKRVGDRPIFIYTKTSTEDIKLNRYLTDLNFYIVDTNIKYFKCGNINILQERNSVDTDLKIREASPKDQNFVKDLAENSFSLSRFHLDPEIPTEKANLIKAQWADNFFQGKRGELMVVAEITGQIVGFLLLLLNADDEMTIDLIAVTEEKRGSGIASQMIDYACRLKPGRTTVVGTQLANSSSIRLYEKLGFCFYKAQYVFHYHLT